MKKFLIAGGALLALLLLAAFLLPMLVDADTYRPDLEAALAEATGREVSLGRLGFGLLPSPSLRAEGITIGEDPRFGEEPFLQADDLAVKVSLLPLLGGRLEVGTVVIDRPSVRILRQPAGWNISSLLEPPGGPGAASGAPASASGGPEGARSDGGSALTIREVRLDGGRLVYVDAGSEAGPPLKLRAEEVQAHLTDLSAAEPMGIDLSLSLGGGSALRVLGTLGPLQGAGAAEGWPVKAGLTIQGLDSEQAAPWLEAFTGLKILAGSLEADLHVEGRLPERFAAGGTMKLAGLEIHPLVGEGKPVRLDATLALDGELDGDQLRVSRGDVGAGAARLSVTGGVREIWSDPALSLKIRSETAPVAGVLPVLALLGPVVPKGVGSKGTVSLEATVEGSPEAPSLRGRAVLAGLELSDPALKEPLREVSGTAVLEPGGAAVEGFKASLGRSRLEGSCRIRGFDAPVISLDLKAPMLDVDELLTLMASPGAGSSAAPAAGGAGAPSGAKAASPLARVTLTGKVAAAQARLMNLALSDFSAALELKGGRARVGEARLNLYGGSFKGEIAADLARKGPPFTLNASLAGVDFNAMASDFSADLSGLLFGTLDAGLDLTGRGLARADFQEALEGDATFSLVDGKLTSVGVLKDLAAALESAGGRGIGQEETPFSFLGGTFRVKRGKVKTEDLKLESPDIEMKGDGQMTLDLGLDLDLTARISPEVTADMVARRENLRFLKDKKERIRLDLKLQGSLMEPAVRVDPEMIRRILKSATREKLKEGGLKNLLQKKDGGE